MNISVCICTYNQALYIEQAIRSVLCQTYLPVEVIVSDDCSTDETPMILEKLSAEISVLKVVYQPENVGIARNTDQCLRLASGDFIIRLDSDDYLAPDYTEKLMHLLVKHPGAGYAHAAIQEVDQDGTFLKQRKLFRKSGFQSGTEALRAAVKGYRVAANILMFRKEALMQANYLLGRPNFGEDYHLTTNISALGFGNVYLNETLAFYRVWVDPKKVRQRRKIQEISGIRRVFDDIIEPAYIDRGWCLDEVKISKTDFACRHADCLGWDVYNAAEKRELAVELYNLSSSVRVKAFVWLYSQGFSYGVDLYFKLLRFPKVLLKDLFHIIRRKSGNAMVYSANE